MSVLDTLLEIEKELLGLAEAAVDTAGKVVTSVVKTAAEGVREVIDTLGGAASRDDK